MKRILAVLLVLLMAIPLCAAALPKTAADYKVADENDFLVTNEAAFAVMEEILSGRTDLLKTEHKVEFVPTDDNTGWFVSFDGKETNMMLVLLSRGDITEKDEKIDYISLISAGSPKMVEGQREAFELVSLAAILASHPEIDDEEAARELYLELSEADPDDPWYAVGGLEYINDLTVFDADFAMAMFGVRTAENYKN